MDGFIEYYTISINQFLKLERQRILVLSDMNLLSFVMN